MISLPNTTSIYLFHEGVAKKRTQSNLFYSKYLNVVAETGNYTELRLLCDNCSSQNKNQSLSRFCLYLTDSGKFDKVTKHFPVREHSFLPCNQDLGLISKCLRTHAH